MTLGEIIRGSAQHEVLINDPAQRRMGNCTVLPWKVFPEKLLAGEIMA